MNDAAIINMNNGQKFIFIGPKRGKNYHYDKNTFYLNTGEIEFAIPYTSILYIEFKSITLDELSEFKNSGIPIYYLVKEDEKL